MVVDLGWVNFDFYLQSSCLMLQPLLQNEAGSETPKINVNSTHVNEHLFKPVRVHQMSSSSWRVSPVTVKSLPSQMRLA